jgi:hypothetical protein
VIALLLLWYLFRPNVRAAFRTMPSLLILAAYPPRCVSLTRYSGVLYEGVSDDSNRITQRR